MQKVIPIHIKKTCLKMKSEGVSCRKIYDEYFSQNVINPQSYNSFRVSLLRWANKQDLDDFKSLFHDKRKGSSLAVLLGTFQ